MSEQSFSISISLDESVQTQVKLGWIQASKVVVGSSSPTLIKGIQETCDSLVAEHAGKSPAEIVALAPARKLYRSFGIDPTRTRPSSEALLRRILKHIPFPLINIAVDLCNWFSLRFMLSLGLYDADKIQGSILLRTGTKGEAYPGIRKDQVNLEGRLVLSDSLGPFGNPSSDSLRTSVTEATGTLLMIIFAPADYSNDLLQKHVDFALQVMPSQLGSSEQSVTIQGGLVL